jgi:predicted ester cyclase
MTVREQAQRFYAVLDAQDWGELATLVAPDLRAQLGSAAPVDFAAWQQRLREFYEGFPAGHHVFDAYLVDGAAAVTRGRFQGTHTGVFRGVPPSGKTVSVGVIHIDHFADGKLVRHFGQLDALGLLQRLGADAGSRSKD